jgi:hypothetical protein
MTIMVVLWLGLVGLVLAEPYTLQWTEPTTREDGTYLPQEQIYAYGILVDDIYATFSWPRQTSAVIEIDTSEPHIITMVTLDSSYNLSKPSNGVGIPLTPPVAPGICVSE